MLKRKPPSAVAAIDLGSNSFHMIVARIVDGEVHMLDRLRESVRLAGGLDEHNRLSDEARERALECLSRFGQRVRDLPRGSVRIVGTNTLRKAQNSGGFLHEAQQVLGHPIEIISGVEEARLIYLGVSHSLASVTGRRLVVDIGGGSTELIIGEGFDPLYLESLYMGCVSMTGAYFGDGKIGAKAWRRAVIAARLELRPVGRSYRQIGWGSSVGASGTLLAVARVVGEMGWSDDGITLDSLYALRDAMIDAGSIKKLDLAGLSKERARVFPGGVAVLQGVFEGLNIERMSVSDGALREGLIYDLLGRLRHEDVRGRTIKGLMSRFQVDGAHAQRVRRTALTLLEQGAERWELYEDHADMLEWAALLHEVGLAIAHSQYHKHGAYLIGNADLPGFSQQEQRALAALVRAHRRKFPLDVFEEIAEDQRQALLHLAVLLRLAVLFHRSRGDYDIPIQRVGAGEGVLQLAFEDGFLDEHPLTQGDLEYEREYLGTAGFQLDWGS